MTTVIEYKIFCLSEKRVISGLTYSPLTPVCPHDSTHLVKAGTLQKIREIKEQTVEIKQDSITTGGNFQYRSYELNVPGDTGTTGIDITFDIPISVKTVGYLAGEDLVGDYVNTYAIPNYSKEGLIGYITQDAQKGTQVLSINERATRIVQPYYRLIVNDGTKLQDLGEVKKINPETNQVTIEFPLKSTYRKGSALQLLIHRIKNCYLHDQQMPPIGTSSFQSTPVPPNVGTRVVYTNVNKKPKKFRFYTEISY